MSDRWQARLASGETVVIEPVLRRLDGRRVSGLVTFGGVPRFAKAFIGAKARRDAHRETTGLTALKEAGLRSPELIERANLADGGELMILDRVEGVSPGRGDHHFAERLLSDLAAAHNAGVVLNDPHLDNVFVAQDGRAQNAFWLDGGDVINGDKPVSKGVGYRNACRLLAEFSPTNDEALIAALRGYESLRGFAVASDVSAREQLMRARRARIRLIVSKTTRQCTAFSVRKSTSGFGAWSNDSTLPLEELLASAPGFDDLLADAEFLKSGNSAQVAKTTLQGESLVVKQTRAKSWPRLLRRVVKGSRARRSWSYGHVLGYFDVPTAQPLLLHERHIGPLVPDATLVCRALVGPTLDQTDSQSAENVAAAARLIAAIHKLGLRHGDTKASNFVVTCDGVYVVDLDAMSLGSRVDCERDRDRFLANFGCDSEQLATAREVFDRDPLY